jgi:hypothetical protein
MVSSYAADATFEAMYASPKKAASTTDGHGKPPATSYGARQLLQQRRAARVTRLRVLERRHRQPRGEHARDERAQLAAHATQLLARR